MASFIDVSIATNAGKYGEYVITSNRDSDIDLDAGVNDIFGESEGSESNLYGFESDASQDVNSQQ